MAIKMTGIQRLRYHAAIGKDNPFRDEMMKEVISGNMIFDNASEIADPANVVDEILGIIVE